MIEEKVGAAVKQLMAKERRWAGYRSAINESEAEVVRRAVENLRSLHGEDAIRPDMIERIKARIVDVEGGARPTRH